LRVLVASWTKKQRSLLQASFFASAGSGVVSVVRLSGELFLAGIQHGVRHNNSEIPSVYIQLRVCGKFITVKFYYQY
jgi:hypothetical protein